MALNALLVDPHRVWKGVWRWFDETMLDCCDPLDVIKMQGITLPKLGCLARCNGADINLFYAEDVSIDQFRDDVKSVCQENTSKPLVMITSYSRRVLSQSGDGHFSPIGGYHSTKDYVLILDVARFKYPPHWVPLSVFFQAMQSLDQDSGRCRGYMLLSASDTLLSDASSKCCSNNCVMVVKTDTEKKEEANNALDSLLKHECSFCIASNSKNNNSNSSILSTAV